MNYLENLNKLFSDKNLPLKAASVGSGYTLTNSETSEAETFKSFAELVSRLFRVTEIPFSEILKISRQKELEVGNDRQ